MNYTDFAGTVDYNNYYDKRNTQPNNNVRDFYLLSFWLFFIFILIYKLFKNYSTRFKHEFLNTNRNTTNYNRNVTLEHVREI